MLVVVVFVVVVCSVLLCSAARVWYTFRLFGAKNVAVLDGGMPAWRAKKSNPMASGAPAPFDPAHFQVTFDAYVATANKSQRSAYSLILCIRGGSLLDFSVCSLFFCFLHVRGGGLEQWRRSVDVRRDEQYRDAP